MQEIDVTQMDFIAGGYDYGGSDEPIFFPPEIDPGCFPEPPTDGYPWTDEQPEEPPIDPTQGWPILIPAPEDEPEWPVVIE